MTDEEIIEWAVANNIEFHTVKQQVRVGFHALAGTDSMPALRRLCVMAAAKEREACAKVCDAIGFNMGGSVGAHAFAHAIRSRK